MIFETFCHWKDRQPESLIDEEEQECEDCAGLGEYECTCCGHERTCETCGGFGFIDQNEQSILQLGRLYVEDISSTAKDLCYFAGRGDYLDIMADFIKQNGRPDVLN
ncbi:hypothetical protein LMG33818_002164 [Halomonadaceae bacterium LMG 33818]|uniref:hypothetical protein n=1 Tax=Cernens ardua TaxID=3402176 RepID=UPI003EDB9F72